MLSFSPAFRGRGRLALAVVASILVHSLAFIDWWPAAWLSGVSRIAALGGSDPLIVFLGSHRPSALASIEQGTVPGEFTPRPRMPVASESLKSHSDAGAEVASAEYLPKERLSTPAQPLSDIHIPWPAGLPTIGASSAVFTLFIDELGVVKDVVPDGHTLSPVMEEVARNAFLVATFRPALLNGRSVKSIKRVEVVFEYLPVQVPQDVPEIVSTKPL